MDDSHLCRANVRMRQTAQHSHVYNVPAACQAVLRQLRRSAARVRHVQLLPAVFSQHALCLQVRISPRVHGVYSLSQMFGGTSAASSCFFSSFSFPLCVSEISPGQIKARHFEL